MSWGSILEVVLHADFVKNWDIFNHNSFVKLVVGVSNFLENEQLIDFLLFHDKILARNYSKELLTY